MKKVLFTLLGVVLLMLAAAAALAVPTVVEGAPPSADHPAASVALRD